MKFIYNDGGRSAAGYKGNTGDCVTRAIAIAFNMPYQEAYDLVNSYGSRERGYKHRRKKSSARTGVAHTTTRRILADLGAKWQPTMGIGTGCMVHMRVEELPAGRIIVSVSKHVAAIIDGELHDTHDGTRDGQRCVYGYWIIPNAFGGENEKS